MSDNQETMPKSLKRFLPLFALAMAMAAVYAFDLLRFFRFDYIVQNYTSLTQAIYENFLPSLLAFMAIYAAITALSLPVGSILTLVGGVFFGGLLGTVGTVIGATIGATIVFLIAQTSLGDRLLDKAGDKIQKMKEGFQEDSFNYLLFLRLVPVFPFWLVNLAPALLGMRLGPYVLGTFIGIIPGTAAFSFVGAGLGSVFEAQKKSYDACLASATDISGCSVSIDTSSLITVELLSGFALLGVVALIPIGVRKLAKKKDGGALHE